MKHLHQRPHRIVIFASGNGSNAERLIHYFQKEEAGDVVRVITNKSGAGVLRRAQKAGVIAEVLPKEIFNNGTSLLAHLQSLRADFIILAGYLKLVPEEVIRAYEGAMVNIHPSLLPKYGGKGMYGMRVHEAVIAAGDSESGITIHLVNEKYDQGKVILQEKVQIAPGMTAEDLAKSIHQLEHAHFPIVVKQLLIEKRHQDSQQIQN